VREQVDDADEERHEQREEEELDRPAAYDAAADPEEARRPPVELEPLVERSHELLGRPAERGQPRAVEALRVVAERRRRALAARRERDRGYAARDERPLPVQRERKAEVDQLAEDRGSLMRRAAVATRSAVAVRGVSPEMTSRGLPEPARAVRLTTATTLYGSRCAKRVGPSPPNAAPSVERKTSVCAGRTRPAAAPDADCE